jgi:hypothetical protein
MPIFPVWFRSVDITFIYMMFVLKIPILMLFGIVWWAMKAKPEDEEAAEGGGGEKQPTNPARPRGRGPHGEPQPPAPSRIRVPAPRERVTKG